MKKLLRSGNKTINDYCDVINISKLFELKMVNSNSDSTFESASKAELFRQEYNNAIEEAKLFFPREEEKEVREEVLSAKRTELLIKYGFFKLNKSNDTQPPNQTLEEKNAKIIKNFIQTCKKYDPKEENTFEFFERFERKLNAEQISDELKINLLDLLVPTKLYLPFEHELSCEEQFKLYKKRCLFADMCTPIDILYKAVNATFNASDSFDQIFSKLKYLITKVNEAFPKENQLIICTWLLFLKGIHKSSRLQMSNECRPDYLNELQSSLLRFSTSRNRLIGSYFSDYKPKTNNSNDKPCPSPNNDKPNSSADLKEAKPKCLHCSKTGHVEANCWIKFPSKKPEPKNKNIHHSFVSSNKVYRDGVQFILSGKLNNKNSSNILFDTGAAITAFNSKYCHPDMITNETLTISTLKNDIAVGTYPVVLMQVQTPIFEGIVEGVSVDNLKHDAILPSIYQDDKKLVLDLKTAKISVLETETPSNSSNLTTEVIHDSTLPEVKSTVTQGNDVPEAESTSEISKTSHDNVNFNSNLFNNVLPKAITIPLIKNHQKTDPCFQDYFKDLKTNKSIFVKPNVELVIIDDLLCKVNSGLSSPFSIMIPKSLKQFFLKHYHDDNGHCSYTNLVNNISDKYFWTNMYKDLQEYCSLCDVCQKDTSNRHHKPVPSGFFELNRLPFQHICIDYITHFDTSHSGNSYLLTIVDVATRFANVIPLKTLTAEETLNKLIDFHFYKYGFPKKITSDNGRQFTSKLFSSYCKERDIENLYTSPRHPQANGICERFNGTFSDMIKHSCLDDLKAWDECVHKSLFHYNISKRSGTKFSPFDLVFSFEIQDCNSKLDINDIQLNVDDFVLNKRLDAEDDRRLAQSNLIDSQIKNKSKFDKNAVERKLSIGDKVLMKVDNKKKMKLKWDGPYEVVGVKSDKLYEIDIKGKVRAYHIDLLKLYKEQDTNVNKDADVIDSMLINTIGYMTVYDNSSNIQVKKQCSDPMIESRVEILIDNFNDIFSDSPSVTNVLTHKIMLKDDEPVNKQSYPIPLAFKEKFNIELKKMLDLGIIEKSNSEYASPCIIVPKKNSENIRVVIDFRSLNNKLVKDREPISLSQSIFSKLSQCKYFTVIDLKHGFWQIPLDPESRKYTAFTTEFGLYQFKVMPYGIANGPAEFSRLMRKLFANEPNVHTFIDDILIATQTIDEHLVVLEKVFGILSKANLKVNKDKCHFCAESINYLGQTLSSEYISPQSEKIECILDAPLPATKKNMQSFLGLCNYFRNYIANFAELTYRLYELVKKKAPKKIIWNETYIQCFNDVKDALSKDIKLFHFNPKLPLILQTDASSYAFGAVLGQRLNENGPVLPIQCISKKLTDTEQRYSTIEKEAFCIVWAVEKFSFYLLGNHFIIESDHEPLSYMNKYSKSKDKLRRWELLLSNFDYEIKYIPGKDNVMSDFLSRI